MEYSAFLSGVGWGQSIKRMANDQRLRKRRSSLVDVITEVSPEICLFMPLTRTLVYVKAAMSRYFSIFLKS